MATVIQRMKVSDVRVVLGLALCELNDLESEQIDAILQDTDNEPGGPRDKFKKDFCELYGVETAS